MHALLESGAIRKLVMAVLAALGLFLLALAATEFKQFGYVGRDIYPQRTVTVSGEAERFVIPDEAEFTFSIIEEAKTFAEAQESATTKVNDIAAYLEEAGVARGDIKTVNYSIDPRYEYREQQLGFCTPTYCSPGTGTRELVGYEVNQTIRVTTDDIDDVGELVAGVGSRGASQVGSVTFTVADEEELLKEVRDEAIADARADAKRIAGSLGTSLGRVVSYNDQGYAPYAVRAEFSSYGFGGDAIGAPVPAPDIPAGENRLSVTVTVTYELR